MTLEVRVRLFAGLAAAVGRRELLWRGPAPATPADVWREMAREYPGLARHAHQVKVAVNQEYAGWDDSLNDGDELAFLTPVSGGAPADAVPPGDGAVPSVGPPEHDRDSTTPGDPRGPGQFPGTCRVTDKPLAVDDVLRMVNRPQAGAIVLFAGIARRYTGSRVTDYLEYDAYEPMAVSEMEKIAAEVRGRWPGVRVAMVHRTGKVDIGEASVLIAASAPHREEAFSAARYAIDRLKERVPIWKKEVWAGGEMWVGDDPPPSGDGAL